MFRGFNLELEDVDLDKYYKAGSTLYSGFEEKVRLKLDTFVNDDGSLNASQMKANWFPQIDANIFISHSHKDEVTAISLAGWFYEELNLISFVDSCIWGYSNKLLRLLDNNFCYNEHNDTYSYQKRNYSTSHVHMMLSTALSMMIDRTECLIFLNTPNSITPSNVITNRSETLSPWIYSEIAMTQLIRKKSLDEHRGKMQKANALFSENEMKIKYDIDLSHLIDIDVNVLKNWWNEVENLAHAENALDILYKICPTK